MYDGIQTQLLTSKLGLMGTLYLKNTTGRRTGSFVRYEYGEDLFGFLYLDVYRSRKHVSDRVRSMLFRNLADLVISIDMDLERRENMDYVPHRVPGP